MSETTAFARLAMTCAFGFLIYTGTVSGAYAANECTGGVAPAPGSTVTCNAGSYLAGITYSVANLTLELNSGVSLTGIPGLVLGTTGSAPSLGSQTINALNAPIVSVQGLGIAAFGVSSTVTVTGGSIASVNTNGYGVQAFGAGGDVLVTVNGTEISPNGTGAHAINATTSGSGGVKVINSGSLTVTGAGASAINATTGSTGTGSVEVTQSGTLKVTNSGGTAGVLASSNGNVLVTMSGGSIESNSTIATGRGIDARALGSGSVTVNMTAGSISTTGGIALLPGMAHPQRAQEPFSLPPLPEPSCVA